MPTGARPVVIVHVFSLFVFMSVFLPSRAMPQTTNACAGSKTGSLACVVVDLVSANLTNLGLPLPAGQPIPTGIAAVTGQLSSAAPLPSPASGFVYSFDSSAGVFTRSTESYGPVLSERAETIGARRVFVGFADQYFNFTRVDGIHLSNIPANFDIGGGALLFGNFDVHLRLNQFTIFGTYGLANRLDISVAMPVVSAQFGGTHKQQLLFGTSSVATSATIDRSAAGIGDVEFQIKSNVIRREKAGLAFGVKLRTPTGDAYNLLGAGAMGIRPFVAASATFRHRLSPHINAGYQWNGQSVLAGDIVGQTKRSIPGNISYAAGTEIILHRRVTVNVDVLGEELIHADRWFVANSQPSAGSGLSDAAVGFYRGSYNATSGSAGLKVNPGGRFLIVCNFMFRLNHGGLAAAVVPLVGLSYVR